MDQKRAALPNPEGQPPKKHSPTMRDYFIPKRKRGIPKKNGWGGASAPASRGSVALSTSRRSEGNFITEKTSRVTTRGDTKLHEILTQTAVPVVTERERLLALCAAIDIHEHHLPVPAGDGSSITPKASEVDIIDLVDDSKPSASTPASVEGKKRRTTTSYKNWKDPKNWQIVKEALRMARLIGPGNVITEIPRSTLF